jgi:hypothetical protein
MKFPIVDLVFATTILYDATFGTFVQYRPATGDRSTFTGMTNIRMIYLKIGMDRIHDRFLIDLIPSATLTK